MQDETLKVELAQRVLVVEHEQSDLRRLHAHVDQLYLLQVPEF